MSDALKDAVLARPADYRSIPFPWGELTWFVSAAQGNANCMTVGRCVLKPGCSNARHYHPNCDEVLQVLEGRIDHYANGTWVKMSAGDTLYIPAHVRHYARNTGEGEAVLLICFSSADRQTVEE